MWKVVLTDSELPILALGSSSPFRTPQHEREMGIGNVRRNHDGRHVRRGHAMRDHCAKWTTTALADMSVAARYHPCDGHKRLYRVPFIVCIPWIDLSIDVVDSFIEAESVPAITAFFSKPHRVSFQLVIEGLEGWKCWGYHYTSRHPVQTSHPASLRRCPRAWALPSQSSSATQA